MPTFSDDEAVIRNELFSNSKKIFLSKFHRIHKTTVFMVNGVYFQGKKDLPLKLAPMPTDKKIVGENYDNNTK